MKEFKGEFEVAASAFQPIAAKVLGEWLVEPAPFATSWSLERRGDRAVFACVFKEQNIITAVGYMNRRLQMPLPDASGFSGLKVRAVLAQPEPVMEGAAV